MNEASKRAIEDLAERDGRYRFEAYAFIFEALGFTVEKMGRAHLSDEGRHISGRDLLAGISEYAFNEYGPLTRAVFAHWRVFQTRDFGEIVFSLVAIGEMGKTEHDRIEDFIDVYDFDEEFDWKRRRAAQKSIKKT